MEKLNKILVMLLLQTAAISAFAGDPGKGKVVAPAPVTSVGTLPTDLVDTPPTTVGDKPADKTAEDLKNHKDKPDESRRDSTTDLVQDHSKDPLTNQTGNTQTLDNSVGIEPLKTQPIDTTTDLSKLERKADPIGAAPVAAEKSPCSDAVLKDVLAALNKKDPNILGLLFEMTALRLARQAKSDDPKHKTLEDLASRQLAGLKKNFEAIPGAEGVKTRIKEIYKEYELSVDVAELNKFSGAGGSVKPCYWSCKGSRFLNAHSSAYALALSFKDQSGVNENLRVTESDAAVIAAVEKIRETAEKSDPSYAPKTEKGNLMQISNRVARYLGAIAGGENLSQAELESRLESDSAHLEIAIGEAIEAARITYIDCVKKDPKNADCPSCIADQTAKFEAPGISEVIKGLLKKVAGTTPANLNISGLKGVANEVDFDLRNFAKGNFPAYVCKSAMVRNPCPPHNMIKCVNYAGKTGVTESQYTAKVYEKRAEEVKVYQANKKAEVKVTEVKGNVPTASQTSSQKTVAPEQTQSEEQKAVQPSANVQSEQTTSEVVVPAPVATEAPESVGITSNKIDESLNGVTEDPIGINAKKVKRVSPEQKKSSALDEQLKHVVIKPNVRYKKPEIQGVGINQKHVDEARKPTSEDASQESAIGIQYKNVNKKKIVKDDPDAYLEEQSEYVKRLLKSGKTEEEKK